MATKKGQSRGKSSHGGRRSGAGRKPQAVSKLRAELIAEADRAICDHLPQLIKNMIVLADGGYRRVEEKWEPGEVITKGEDGKITTQPGMVLVERKVSIADRDRAANQYLIDRVLGKATERHEHDFSKLKDAELLAEIAGLVAGSEAPGDQAPGG